MVENGVMEQTTSQRILTTARSIVRQRGYSAFSYADIAEQVGIRKASIHYHFPSKDALVQKLVQQYREDMARQCDVIEQSGAAPPQQLREFVRLYQRGLNQEEICLCAMLAADFAVLPGPVKQEITAYFQTLTAWLTRLLDGFETPLGIADTGQAAQVLLATLQGAQLMARAQADRSRAFEQIVYPLLEAQIPAV